MSLLLQDPAISSFIVFVLELPNPFPLLDMSEAKLENALIGGIWSALTFPKIFPN